MRKSDIDDCISFHKEMVQVQVESILECETDVVRMRMRVQDHKGFAKRLDAIKKDLIGKLETEGKQDG